MVLGVLSLPVSAAEGVRIATYSAELSRKGPGLLLRDILKKDDPQITATLAVIVAQRPDILLLTEFDHDPDGQALDAFAQALGAQGMQYPFRFAAPSNAGFDPDHDRDGNGRRGEDRDGQGYGRFRGDGALALLSRWPITVADVQDYSTLLWHDLPEAQRPVLPGQTEAFPTAELWRTQRLSSSGHWVVPIAHPDGPITLLVYGATPPVFDGPEDRNGKRNADELLFWGHYLDGMFGPPPRARFILMGKVNLDPVDGEGQHQAIRQILADPRLQDPRPQGPARAQEPGHLGDPRLDTAQWQAGAPGALRVDYILPSADWILGDRGVFWPEPGSFAPLGPDGLAAGPHKLVWVDLWAAEP